MYFSRLINDFLCLFYGTDILPEASTLSFIEKISMFKKATRFIYQPLC